MSPSIGSPSPQGKTFVDKIRQEIGERGSYVVTRTEARMLWDGLSAGDGWNAIAGLAIAEHWSFTFLPDGSVRFAEFDSD
jgi:hypothetical protein